MSLALVDTLIDTKGITSTELMAIRDNLHIGELSREDLMSLKRNVAQFYSEGNKKGEKINDVIDSELWKRRKLNG